MLGIPVFCLESIVWKSSWEKTPERERPPLEQDLIGKPQWIVDGVSARVRQAADLVVFLDVPQHVCAWRGMHRYRIIGSGVSPEQVLSHAAT